MPWWIIDKVTQGAVLGLLALLGFAAGSNLGAASAPAMAATTETAPMTYRGKTIEDFAILWDLPIDDPYLIAAFEDLCRSEEA